MIWCVEDDASIRDIEVYALQSTGYEAKGFEDGTSFLKELKNQKPELVVLDVMLPGIDGITLLQKLKEDPETREIPVVMATAKGAEYDKIQGKNHLYSISILTHLCKIKKALKRAFLFYTNNGVE